MIFYKATNSSYRKADLPAHYFLELSLMVCGLSWSAEIDQRSFGHRMVGV